MLNKPSRAKILESGLLHFFRCNDLDREEVRRFLKEENQFLEVTLKDDYQKVIDGVRYVYSLEEHSSRSK